MSIGKPIQKTGELVECITSSVKQFGVNPSSPITVRFGKNTEEFEIAGLAVKPTLLGRRLIIKLKPKA